MRSPSRVDDQTTGKRRYFDSYEAGSEWVKEAAAQARDDGEQCVDRFYLWHAGTCYSITPEGGKLA